ncbi:MAG TPA: DUF4352 domain-containing protein [Virgibacillus sp.]|nr:DUF4352 domain-containing protein [Virgibacillus sp.]
MATRKVHIYAGVAILMLFMIFAGCSSDNNNANNTENNANQEETNTPSNNENDNQSGSGNNNDEANNGDNNTDEGENDNNVEDNDEKVDESASGDWGDDELELSIGDTGTLHNNFSKTEITLDSVEVIEDEDDETYFGQFTVLNMTVKNIGDEPVPHEDIFEATELAAEDLDVGGEVWEIFDGVSGDWPDEIDVDEEASGRLVFDVEEADEYELQIDFGLGSVSNKVSFQFDEDEID